MCCRELPNPEVCLDIKICGSSFIQLMYPNFLFACDVGTSYSNCSKKLKKKIYSEKSFCVNVLETIQTGLGRLFPRPSITPRILKLWQWYLESGYSASKDVSFVVCNRRWWRLMWCLDLPSWISKNPQNFQQPPKLNKK